MPPQLQREIEAEIKSKIEAFATDLTETVLAGAAADVCLELARSLYHLAGEVEAIPGSTNRKIKKPAKARPKGKAITPAKGKGDGRKGRPSTVSAADIEALSTKALKFIASNPNASKGMIGKELGVSTDKLRLPIMRLQEQKVIRTTGVKRGTRYHAA